MIRESDKFQGIPEARYYKDYREDLPAPYVVVFATTGEVTLQGIGFDRDEMNISVWFVQKSKRGTKTKLLYEYHEQLRELLHTNPRLSGEDGGLPDCQYAKVASFRQLFGDRGSYFLDIMEVNVLVRLYKTF